MKYFFRKFNYKSKFSGNFIKLSNLFYKASEEYEDLFKKCKINKLKFIKEILNKKNSELEEIILLLNYKEIIGLVTGFPEIQFKSRKLTSLLIIRNMTKTKNINEFIKKNLIEFNARKDGIYISRLAVSHKYQGKGIGTNLLNKFFKNAKKKTIQFHFFTCKKK